MANQIEVKRTFHAPVEMVWRIWTDPELVKRWWGPKHFFAPVAVLLMNFSNGFLLIQLICCFTTGCAQR